MNQPKFKIGDVLFSHSWKCKFEVDSIRITASGIYYAEETTDYVEEKEVELYQEPQKKKLYAYSLDDIVIHLKKKYDHYYHAGALWNRSPEYDIEYPEVKERE